MELKAKNIITPGELVNLDDYPPEYTGVYEKKGQTKKRLKKLHKQLLELQGLLYAESQHGLLIILQGMDTCGKDGTIRRVMEGRQCPRMRCLQFQSPDCR